MNQEGKTSHTHKKPKEPLWLQRRSHCSVINLAHVGEPFVAPSVKMEPYKILCVVQLHVEPLWLRTHNTKGAFEGAEEAMYLNGSSGSLKSSLSFVCVGPTGVLEVHLYHGFLFHLLVVVHLFEMTGSSLLIKKPVETTTILNAQPFWMPLEMNKRFKEESSDIPTNTQTQKQTHWCYQTHYLPCFAVDNNEL